MIVLNPCSAGFSSTWMGDRPGTNFCPWRLMFTSASSQIKFIRKKKRSFGPLHVPINEIPSSTLILVRAYSLITPAVFFLSSPPPRPRSVVFILPLACSLHFTISLQFTPGLQSAVCGFTLTVSKILNSVNSGFWPSKILDLLRIWAFQFRILAFRKREFRILA